jgi:hypothetical protein
MRKDSLIPSLLGIPPIQISRELLLVEKCANRPGRLTNRTVNSYIHALSGVFGLADKEGHFEGRNPFVGRTLEETNSSWRSYKTEELNKLLARRYYATCQPNSASARLSTSLKTRWLGFRWSGCLAECGQTRFARCAQATCIASKAYGCSMLATRIRAKGSRRRRLRALCLYIAN